MKRKLVLSLVIVLFAFSLVSAIDMELSKDKFFPGETLQLEIPNVFIGNLQLSNIGIYEGDAVHKSPSEAGLVKPEKKYLYYAVLPEKTGNYSIQIEDVKYYEGSVIKEETIYKNFTIIATNESYVSFDPGYVYTGSDFSIAIKAYNAYQDVSVEFAATGVSDQFSDLGYGETKTLFFSIDNIKTLTKDDIQINGYTIPAVITPKVEINNSGTSFKENYTLDQYIFMDPPGINATLLYDLTYYYEIFLVNRNQSLDNLILTSSNPEIQVSPEKINLLSGERTINLTIRSKKAFMGYVNISRGSSYLKIPINIDLTENNKDVFSNVDSVNQVRTCSVLGGIKCNLDINELCSGSETQASDGLCCIGKCDVKSGSMGWIIGLVIILILGIGGWFLYQKSKEQGPTGDKLRQIFQKRADEYTQRVAPKKEPLVEVRKSLSKD